MNPVAMVSPNDVSTTTPDSDAHGDALDSAFFHLGKPESPAANFGPELDEGLRKVRDFIARGVPCTKPGVLCNRALLHFTNSDDWLKPRIGDRYCEVMRELLESYIDAGLIHLDAPFTLQITGATKVTRMPLERVIRKKLPDVVVEFIGMGVDEKLVPYSSSFGGGKASDILDYTRSELLPEASGPMVATILYALMERRVRESAAHECKSVADVAAASEQLPSPARRRKVL